MRTSICVIVIVCLMTNLFLLPFAEATINDNHETFEKPQNKNPLLQRECNGIKWLEESGDRNLDEFVNVLCFVFGHVTIGARLCYGILQTLIFIPLLNIIELMGNPPILSSVIQRLFILSLLRPRLIYPYIHLTGQKAEVDTIGLLGYNHAERNGGWGPPVGFDIIGFIGLWNIKPLKDTICFAGIAFAIK
jgi:hypothetical protein